MIEGIFFLSFLIQLRSVKIDIRQDLENIIIEVKRLLELFSYARFLMMLINYGRI